MTSVEQRQLRDRRDHLIDLLGLGQTYPLPDLPLYLPTTPYLVPYNKPARIGVETSQPTVLYQLYENGRLVERAPTGEAGQGVPVERPGNQARIRLSSYNIQEDKTFQVWAVKFTYRFALDSAFAAALDQGQASEALRQAFLDNGEITLAGDVTITPDAGTDLEPPPESEPPTFTWVVRSGGDTQASNRFLIRNLDNLLAVYQMSDRAVYLDQTAEVRVGLDQSLNAWVGALVIDPETTRDAPFLEVPGPINQPLTAARLIDYGDVVRVKIESSQEGVYYRLLAGELDETENYPAASDPDQDQVVLAPEDDAGDGLGKLGTGEDITLTTIPMTEDIDIRIRATKTFPETPNRDPETIFLDVILPLRVRANPAPPVEVVPAPIIDFNEAPSLTLAESQSSAVYSPYRRRILDREFIHGSTEADVLTVAVPDEEAVKVPQPARPHPWQDEDNTAYTQAGSALPGTDAALTLPLEALGEDSLVIIKVEKSHRLATFDQADSRLIPSAVQLRQAVLILTRPDPNPVDPETEQPFRLEATMDSNQTNGEIAVFNGQLGVFYLFRLSTADDLLSLPAYFHQLDDLDPDQNKGLGQLTIGVDFVVPRSHPAGQPADPARTPPALPVVETDPLAAGAILHLQAIKAQTRVKAAMTRTASIPALPVIQVEDPIVDYNKDTRLIVIDSLAGDRYQPFPNGEAFKQARLGNGEDLIFRTDPLTADTVYEMRVTQPNSDHLPLTRIVRLPIIVRPNPNLAFSPREAIIDFGDRAAVQLNESQPGVRYQFWVGDSPVGETVTGGGDPVTLLSEPLSDSATLVIRAVRSEYPEAFVFLPTPVEVIVRPNRTLTLTLTATEVEAGGDSIVQVQASQAGVNYQLATPGDDSPTPIGDPVAGNDATIDLPTGPLTETTTFAVQATRIDRPDISVVLEQTVTVQVQTDEGST